TQTLGIELGAMYWHFLDFLWVYLFVFLYFFK
ncbi:MAG: cytochrome c oxidase subunit 3, partial [Flavobacterium sp.]